MFPQGTNIEIWIGEVKDTAVDEARESVPSFQERWNAWADLQWQDVTRHEGGGDKEDMKTRVSSLHKNQS